MSAPQVTATERWKEAVLQEWADPRRVAAWRRWHPQFAAMSRAATEAIVAAARVAPGMQVLDLASGTGEPALTLARAVAPDGHVTATDLTPGMLAAAEENARAHSLTNIRFRQADAEALPFADQSCDRVTCRFGVMFFADLGRALRQIYRVLRPGGRAAFIAWAPLELNPYFAVPMGILQKYAPIPQPEPGAPNPFRFAVAGTLAQALEQAGFRQVEEEYRSIPWSWPGSVEEAWQGRQELSPILHRLMANLTPAQRAQASAEVLAAFRPYHDGNRVNFPAVIVLASAAR